MQRVNIYNDIIHLTGEWMNADMLNRGTEDTPHPPSSLSLSLFFLGGGGYKYFDKQHFCSFWPYNVLSNCLNSGHD